MDDKILLSHGSGGLKSYQLIRDLFYRKWENDLLITGYDAAVLSIPSEAVAFTTDAFVVDPIFFPGGDIGKLAICGTVNDLAVMGAVPRYLAISLIIEEGFSQGLLEKIADSIAKEAIKAEVKIVTGDTKVVDRGKCDKIFITTTGIGEFIANLRPPSPEKIRPGDKILINGGIAEHGMAVLAARENLPVNSNIHSDCASLNHLIASVSGKENAIKFMRDATRGGLATVLCELAELANLAIEVSEDKIPVDESVRGFCELLGFDPLYVANEGKVCMVVARDQADEVLNILQHDPLGQYAAIIGEVVESNATRVVMETAIGGKRIVSMLEGGQLPRIC